MTEREIYPSLDQLPLRLSKDIELTEPPPEAKAKLLAAGRDPDSPCWVWTKGRNSSGYGIVKWRGKVWGLHQLCYHLLVAPLTQPGKMRERDGDVIDHLCHWNRACCNPGHMEKITQGENVRRGNRHR